VSGVRKDDVIINVLASIQRNCHRPELSKKNGNHERCYLNLRTATKRENWKMCLAIPSKITQIKDNMATIDVDGVQREASLLLLEDAGIGDFVIVHAGFAIQKIDEAAARETLKFLKEAAAFVEGSGGESQ
jgi:hydrogenase expression/formation protein HypC